MTTTKLNPAPTEARTEGSQQQEVGRMNRLTIQFNGVEILGATVTCERPKNTGEMNSLLRELLAMSAAPDVADPEVLGKYSPNNH